MKTSLFHYLILIEDFYPLRSLRLQDCVHRVIEGNQTITHWMLRSRRLPDFNRSLNDAETIGSGVLDGGVGAVSEAEGADPDWLEPDA